MSECKNELEKCMAGEYYNCHDEIFLEYKTQARKLLKEYHALAYEQKDEKTGILKQLFGSIGTNVSVGLPFICDYGRNIHLGNNVSVNMNCTFVDCNTITIGDDVLIASNVQLYTATHPVELTDRLTPDWCPGTGQYFCRTYALPIRIGNGCWLGGGVIVQRFGDLVRGRRSNEKRIEEGLVQPTLAATPGDLSLVLPKRILDGIIEMIYALDKIAPGTANDDTLLYGVEVKFYNMEVAIDEHLETRHKGLYIIGDGSGVTHSLSHASASGVYVARNIAEVV